MTNELELKAIRDELLRVKDTLAMFIVWTAQSTGSPISHDDAEKLMKHLTGK